MLHANGLSDFKGRWALNFLWLELTNQCNLQCSHCYADSGPYATQADRLSREKYQELIIEAYEVGCRRIQFIGGEPTLNRDLPDLIKFSAKIGYTFIEVFTNLTCLTDELLLCFKESDVHVATSVYAPTACTHDQITQVHGSFDKTIRNLQALLKAGISVRAGVIGMKENSGQTERTMQFLRDLGVQNVGTDRLRYFGRGAKEGEGALSELCGACADNTLCVGSDGIVSPCIMSKLWSVGSVLNESLTELAKSGRLAALRGHIYRAVIEPREENGRDDRGIDAICTPKTCAPSGPCSPFMALTPRDTLSEIKCFKKVSRT